MTAIADETHLLLLHFVDKKGIDKEIKTLEKNYNTSLLNETNAILEQLTSELSLYFKGQLNQFKTPINFVFGTPFQQKVWSALCEIPYGETISYKQLAQNVGNEKAFRAVANANGRNHHTIIVPCHRVIAFDGSLGGYSSGIDRKKALLNIESSKQ